VIERSHLPFCSDIRQPTGTSLADTWVKMLGQVHRLTGPGARGIADDFPTASSLFEAYENAPDARARDALVMHCKVRLPFYVIVPRPIIDSDCRSATASTAWRTSVS
jgi:hypothetical protein